MSIPHKCPICEGHGMVSAGFYESVAVVKHTTSSHSTETCRSCWGTGLLWEKEKPTVYIYPARLDEQNVSRTGIPIKEMK